MRSEKRTLQVIPWPLHVMAGPGLTPASRMFPTCGLVLSSGSREHPISVPSTPFSPSELQDVDGRHRRQMYAVCASLTAAGHDGERSQRNKPQSGEWFKSKGSCFGARMSMLCGDFNDTAGVGRC